MKQSIVMDLSCYSLEAVHAAVYSLSAETSALVERRGEAEAVVTIDTDNPGVRDRFLKLINDHQLRRQIAEETADIRREIVKEAFSPLN